MSSASQVPWWDVHRLPDAEGKNFLVTGARGHRILRRRAARLHRGPGRSRSRDRAKAEGAIASIGSRVPGARTKHLPLDLADLGPLKTSVEALGLDRLDAVVHHAGVALDHPPRREPRPATS